MFYRNRTDFVMLNVECLYTPRGQCVNRVKHPLLRLFLTPTWYMKTYIECLYAITGIIYTV